MNILQPFKWTYELFRVLCYISVYVATMLIALFILLFQKEK